MNKIATIQTHFYSGNYQEYEEFINNNHNRRGYLQFLEDIYKLKNITKAMEVVPDSFLVTDDAMFMMFMMKYPEFVVNVKYE